MFVKKDDPLLESVQNVMKDNDLRRQLENKLNEELGIACKKALPHEHHDEYDRLLEESIQEAKREAGRPGFIKSLKVANHNNRGGFAVPAAASAVGGAAMGGGSTASKAGALAGAALGAGTVAVAHANQIRKDAKMLRGKGDWVRNIDATKADVARYDEYRKKPLHKRLAVRLKAMTGNTDHLYDEEVEQFLEDLIAEGYTFEEIQEAILSEESDKKKDKDGKYIDYPHDSKVKNVKIDHSKYKGQKSKGYEKDVNEENSQIARPATTKTTSPQDVSDDQSYYMGNALKNKMSVNPRLPAKSLEAPKLDSPSFNELPDMKEQTNKYVRFLGAKKKN